MCLAASLWRLLAEHGDHSLVFGECLQGLAVSLQCLQTGWDERLGLALRGLPSLCGIQELLHITGGAEQHMACGLHAEEGPTKNFPGWKKKALESNHKENLSLHPLNVSPSMLPPQFHKP